MVGIAGLVTALIAVVLAVSTVFKAPAAVPADWSAPRALPTSAALPPSTFAFDSDRGGNFELYTLPVAGGTAAQLTNDPAYDSWSPRLSPTRSTILFYRTPAGVHDRDSSKASLWAVGADGSGLVQLRPAGLDGWVQQGHAEWSPDGRSMVMFGGSQVNPQIFVTTSLGQSPTAVTSRPGTNIDPAFTPDGTQILFVGCAQSVCNPDQYEVYRIPRGGGTATRLTNDSLRDQDPVLSPDGRTMAWLTAFGGTGIGTWDVRVSDANGQRVHRLMKDSGVTSRPEFTSDGKSFMLHRIAPGDARFDVYLVGTDGSNPVKLTAGQPGNSEYPSP